MKSKIISATLLGIGFFIGASALSALAAWTAPTETPPTCTSGLAGCDAPVNVGPTLQQKLGSLGTLGLSILGDFKFIPVGGVPPTSGQVLVADDTDLVNGKVKWGTPGSISIGACTAFGTMNRNDSVTKCPSGQVMCGLGRHPDGNWDNTQVYCAPVN